MLERRVGNSKEYCRITGRWSPMPEDDHLRPIETELKLAVPPGHGAQLLEHLAFRAALASSSEEQHEVTTYFDTLDLALARKGFSLRVRQTGGRRMQTLKANAAANSVALRCGEWEWPIEQDEPDLGLLAQLPLDDEAPGRLDGHLEPVFVTDIRRTCAACIWPDIRGQKRPSTRETSLQARPASW